MSAPRTAYAERALPAVARLLTLLDRNPYSPTYGCFHRDYWLYKTSDFPDAVRQFGVHTLALVYARDFPGNIYKGKPAVRDWTIAALDYWARLQHPDGSFDEFYPYERGWVGPTAFTAYTVIEAVNLIADEMPAGVRSRVVEAVRKAALFICAGETEEDHLANHHAMACLAVWKAFELTGDPRIREGYDKVWKGFLSYHIADEGWSREYDGPDPGYLSATVSFLAKIYQTNRAPGIREVIEQSVSFCSFFAYPNGFYAGSLGSRNTQHFYPHGFEILAAEMPMAAAVAEQNLTALDAGGLVPPEIMSDRYVFYRVPELLLSYLDYGERPQNLPALPFDSPDTIRYFPKARFAAACSDDYYLVINLGKGGVLKAFNRNDGSLAIADNGIIAQTQDGKIITTHWVDDRFDCTDGDQQWRVSGDLQVVPSHKVFSLLKNLIFRSVLFLGGWNTAFCHFLKGKIRRTLILGHKRSAAQFSRVVRMGSKSIVIEDKISPNGTGFERLTCGGDFFVRFVPQSRFFQSQELDGGGLELSQDSIDRLNRGEDLCITTSIDTQGIERSIS